MAPSPVYHFTPSMTSAETLEAIFVQRERLLRRLVDLVRDSVLGEVKHHSLLIGPRGIGKTHIISLVYHRVRAMADLKERLRVAWLREDEWGVSSFLDLLISILRALAAEQPDEALEQRIEALFDLPPDEAAKAAARALKEYATGRVVLLLIENLDMVFEGLGDEGQKRLRAFLQENPLFTIVATAQGLFGGVSLRTSPFYGFFSPTHLEPLTLDEATELLAKIAVRRGDSDLARFVRTPTGRARIRAVRHLAGGNHRVYVILSQFLTRESLDELVDAFMKTLDDLTPYYQSRMMALSQQQRKLVELLCERRHAITVKEIAQRSFMSHQTASAQLRTLRELGYVRTTPIGRESYHELQEPLMRLCVEVKKNRGEPIPLFVDLLRLWYSRPELEQRLAGLDGQMRMKPAPIEREYLTQALRMKAVESKDPVIAACLRDLKNYIDAKEFAKALQVTEELVACRGSAGDWYLQGAVLMVLNRPAEALPAIEKATKLDPTDAGHWETRGRVLGDLCRWEESLHAFDMALEREKSDPAIWANRARVLHELGRHQEELEMFDKVVSLAPKLADTWLYRGRALASLSRYEEALASLDQASELEPQNVKVLFARGVMLGNLERHEDALASFAGVLKQEPENISAWHNRALALAKLGRLDEAIDAVDQELAFVPADVDALDLRFNLAIELERFDEALATARKLTEVQPDSSVWWTNFSASLGLLGQVEEALTSADKALALNAEDPLAWSNRATALMDLQRHEDALSSFEKAIELGSGTINSLLGYVEVLIRLRRWDESFARLDAALGGLTDHSDAIGHHSQTIVPLLIRDTSEVSRWPTHITTLTGLYAKHAQLSALGRGIVASISEILSPMVSDAAARTWRDLWQEIGGQHPELQIPLRLLDVAVRHRETKDERILMELPLEERTLLEDIISKGAGAASTHE